MLPQSILLATENVPFYINSATRKRVLLTYKQLHRNLNFWKDDFIRKQLKFLLQQEFAAFKYVTQPARISALLDYAEKKEFQWINTLFMGQHSSMEALLSRACVSYKVKEPPLKRVMFTMPLQCDHSSLVYQANNATIPKVRTFDEHISLTRKIAGMPLTKIQNRFWLLFEVLRRNKIREGKNGRKLMFDLQDLSCSYLNILGEPLALCRQKNSLSRFYSRFIHDSPKPVHMDIIKHVETSVCDRRFSRSYRRAMRFVGLSLFSLNENTGDLVKPKLL